MTRRHATIITWALIAISVLGISLAADTPAALGLGTLAGFAMFFILASIVVPWESRQRPNATTHRVPTTITLTLLLTGILLLLFGSTVRTCLGAAICLVAGNCIAALFGIRFPRLVPMALMAALAIAITRPISIPFSLALLALLWLVIAVLHLRTRRRHPSPGTLSPSNSGW